MCGTADGPFSCPVPNSPSKPTESQPAAHAPGTAPPTKSQDRGTLRAASSISGLTLLSRVLGVIRDSVMMAILGAGFESGTFLLAWLFPNLLRRLFGEGALSAAFIPRYAKLLSAQDSAAQDTLARDTTAKDAAATDAPEPKLAAVHDKARALLADVSGSEATALLIVTAVVVAVCVWAPAQSMPLPGVGPLEAERATTLFFDLAATMFPYVVPICLVALYAGALNSHGVFAIPAACPVILNLFWIGGLVCAAALGLHASTSDAPEAGLRMARFVAWFLLIGGFAQLAWVAIPLARRGRLPRPRFSLIPKEAAARRVFRVMGPAVLGLSLVQINTLLDQGMAYFLVAPGAISYVYLANRLLLFPHALTSLALAVAVFPKLSLLAGDGDRTALRDKLEQALSATVFLAVPASLGLILIAPDLIKLLFEHQRFSAEDSHRTSLTTVCLVAGLPTIGVSQLCARAFYAMDDTGTPARLAGALVFVNLGLNLTFLFVCGMGAAGLALATTITSIVQATLILRWIRIRCPRAASTPTTPTIAWKTHLCIAGASLAMTAMVLLVRWPFDGAESADAGLVTLALGRVGLPVVVGGATYLLVHAAWGTPEARIVINQIKRRLGRS